MQKNALSRYAVVTDPTDDMKVLVKNFAELKEKSDFHVSLASNIEKRTGELLEELEKAKVAFAATKDKVEHDLQKTFKGKVKLNVGGARFETTLTTLTADGDDSVLGAMFSGRHALHADEDGEVFIDRDGAHFAHILNLLRDTKVTVPFRDGSTFFAELEYYNLSAARRKKYLTYMDANGNLKEGGDYQW